MSELAPLPTNRRQLLGGALAGLAGAGLVRSSVAGAVAAGSGEEVKALVTLLGVERQLSETYHRVLAAGLLNVVVAAEVSGFLTQEQEHIGALERELLLRGSSPASQSRSPASGSPATQADALNLLIAAEGAAEAAYLDAMPKLTDPGVVSLAAEIMASEAQHWTLLHILLNPVDLPAAAPAAFVASS